MFILSSKWKNKKIKSMRYFLPLRLTTWDHNTFLFLFCALLCMICDATLFLLLFYYYCTNSPLSIMQFLLYYSILIFFSHLSIIYSQQFFLIYVTFSFYFLLLWFEIFVVFFSKLRRTRKWYLWALNNFSDYRGNIFI